VPGLEEAVELLDGYRARWEVELFSLVLEEGCRVERLQLAGVACKVRWRFTW